MTLFFISTCFFLTAQDIISQADDTIVKPSNEDLFQKELIADMDAMLDLWYVKNEVANAQSVLCQLKDNLEEIEMSDSLLARRIFEIPSMVPLAYNANVKRWIELYVEKRKRSSSALLGLAQYYFPWMQEIFDRYGVPEELICLTIVESGLNPTAVSRAGATGIWQFMYGTGKIYGLEVNTFIDDRRDPYKATDAAARHLRDLYDIFHDWSLAISAYNCGPGNVRKAIARSGVKGQPDFWKIKNYLPKETQNYFPAFIGALYLKNYHTLHGIEAAPIRIPFSVDTVMINKQLHLEQIASVLNIDIEEIRTFNPQYKRDVIPAYTTPYPLRLKANDIIRYIAFSDSIHKAQYDTLFMPLKAYEEIFTGIEDPEYQRENVYHYVKKGESLSIIAKKYNLSVYELKQMNKLSSNYIKPKQRLLVGYNSVEKSKNQPTKPTTASNSSSTTPKPSSTPDYYIVKKGDTFGAIAKKYNISVSRLAEYNGIKNVNVLSVGQKIKIPK